MIPVSKNVLRLKPFFNLVLASIEISFEFLDQNSAQFEFRLVTSALSDLGAVPLLPADQRLRVDELWKKTCFEIFCASDGEKYVEFNVSPLGHWQIYHFARYRELTKPFDRAAITNLYSSSKDKTYKIGFCVEGLEFQRKPLFQSSVVLAVAGAVDYYAYSHPQDQADFHRKDHWLNYCP